MASLTACAAAFLPASVISISILSELNDEFPNHLGLYASVAEPGRVTTGDPVVLLDA